MGVHKSKNILKKFTRFRKKILELSKLNMVFGTIIIKPINPRKKIHIALVT